MNGTGAAELARILRYFADLGFREVEVPAAAGSLPSAPPPVDREKPVRAAASPAPEPAPPTSMTGRRKQAARDARASRVAPASAAGATFLTATADPSVPFPFGDLPSMARFLHDCSRCKLAARRTQVVFGVGNPSARIMFIGEGPGEDEDLQGEPFVGKAGQLLTDIIGKGMGLARSDVYIANVVKCRPPGNRNPEPDEIAACSSFLREQIRLVRPEVLITLGKFASHSILGVDTPITRLRGHWGVFEGTPVMPTLHPAYLLRTPEAKKDVWQDVKQVLGRLGLPLPTR